MIGGIYASLPNDPDLYITTFGGYAVGAQPSDWTSRYGTGFTAQVQTVAGALSGKALRWTKTVAARQGLSWDAVPNVADVEILIRGRSIESGWAAADNFIALYARGGGALGTEAGYRCSLSGQVTNTQWSNAFTKYVAGTSTTLGVASNGPSPNYTVNTWYWSRFRLVGTSLSRRLWQQGASEPGTWDETVTDASVSGSGWTGLQQVTNNPDVEIDFFGVALNGKTVPLLI